MNGRAGQILVLLVALIVGSTGCAHRIACEVPPRVDRLWKHRGSGINNIAVNPRSERLVIDMTGPDGRTLLTTSDLKVLSATSGNYKYGLPRGTSDLVVRIEGGPLRVTAIANAKGIYAAGAAIDAESGALLVSETDGVVHVFDNGDDGLTEVDAVTIQCDQLPYALALLEQKRWLLMGGYGVLRWRFRAPE